MEALDVKKQFCIFVVLETFYVRACPCVLERGSFVYVWVCWSVFGSVGVRVRVCAYPFGCLVLACADVGDAVKTFMSAGCVERVSFVGSLSARRTRSAHFTYISPYEFPPMVVLACFKQPSSFSSVNIPISTGLCLRKTRGSKFLPCGKDKTKRHSVRLCVAFSDG